MVIARAWADGEIKARYGFEIVVEDVGVRIDDEFGGGDRFPQEVRREDFDGDSWALRGGSPVTVATKWAAPPSARSSRSTEVITTWARPMAATARATREGSVGSRGPGKASGHVAKRAGARASVTHNHHRGVLDQHSPMLGQAASSHTVTRPCSFTMARVS